MIPRRTRNGYLIQSNCAWRDVNSKAFAAFAGFLTCRVLMHHDENFD